jgi:hypothetical protein
MIFKKKLNCPSERTTAIERKAATTARCGGLELFSEDGRFYQFSNESLFCAYR